MPNWVSNGLTIEGPKESVNKLKAQMNTPFVDYIEANGDLAFGITQTKYSNPVFSFHNIIAPTDIETYKKQPARSELDVNDPNWWADTVKISETDNSWYNWNIRNWGVKWDVAVPNGENHFVDTYMEEYENGENGVVYYSFNTAWGIPEQALNTLSSQYPDLLFTLAYQEETGWGGECEFLRGTIISHSEYDSACYECDAKDSEEECEECGEYVCTKCSKGHDSECQTLSVESDQTEGEEANA